MPPHNPNPARLLSLDAFRGLVILAMLIVNNLGDWDTTGYFWKHADWIEGTQAQAYRAWWSGVRTADDPWTLAFTQFPLWRHCTLADYVMPGFMLIIGIAIPFSGRTRAAGEGEAPAEPGMQVTPRSAGASPSSAPPWIRVVRRAALLVLLGWILCYFRDQFAAQLYREKPFHVSLGMDVLQLLGVGYLVARILYELPISARVISIIALFMWHWAVLRFWPQGDAPRGTFTEAHNAISAIYAQPWFVWRTVEIGPWISMNWKGFMSVPPAAATMLIGTLMGDTLRFRFDLEPCAKRCGS